MFYSIFITDDTIQDERYCTVRSFKLGKTTYGRANTHSLTKNRGIVSLLLRRVFCRISASGGAVAFFVILPPAAVALPAAVAFCACASLPVYSAIVTNAVNIIAAVITKDICLYIKMLTTKKYIWVFTNLILYHRY